jgi:dCMP deaminase
MRFSRNQQSMAVAMSFAKQSTCAKAKVGAVIARDGRILATGYNGAPAGMKHCDHTCTCKGPNVVEKHLSRCPAYAPCTTAVHAEANTIAFAAKYGVAIANTTMFTTLSPCIPCAQLIINAGIWHVCYSSTYRITDGLDLLKSAGVTLEHMG